MSFGGHVQDMVNRVKQNAALKNARRRRFKGGNDYATSSEASKPTFNFSKMSKNDFQKFKKKLKLESQKEQRKRIMFWLLGVLLPTIIALTIFLLY